MEAKRKNISEQQPLEVQNQSGETVIFDIKPALHFNIKEYRARLKHEKEERKRLRDAKKGNNQ